VAASIPDVGDQDPTSRNSPVVCETDSEEQSLRQDLPDEAACYFNDVDYPDGSFVKSGAVVLRCDSGIWVEAGPSDSDNP
jgi:hypothetical protein